MPAHVGDEIMITSPNESRITRDGEVLEVRRIADTSAYRVRWSDNGHESLLLPGPDVRIRHLHGCGESRERVTQRVGQ